MAPTAVTFPDARYYGYLTAESLTAILTQTGDLNWVNQQYRGCGLLPWAAQVLEKQLLLTHGWDWLNYAVTAQVLKHDPEETFNQVTLTCQLPGGEPQIYRADIIADESRTVQLRGSCASEKVTSVTPYQVKNLALLAPTATLY